MLLAFGQFIVKKNKNTMEISERSGDMFSPNKIPGTYTATQKIQEYAEGYNSEL